MLKVVDRAVTTAEVVEAVEGPEMGGIVTFTGTVRNHARGRTVVRLEYEAYAAMAEKVLETIAGEVAERWPGTRCAVLHRVGVLEPGDVAVAIAVAAAHREAAFEACRHVIERLKEDVPVWKREVYEDGDAWVGLGP